MAVFGYARVSTDGQTLAAQDAELMASGCAKVYQEKVSGARTDRAELGKVLKRLERDDLLIVTRLDRLARSTRDLLNILHVIADRGGEVQVAARSVVRHLYPAGRAIGDGPGRFRHVRAPSDKGTNR
jgi:DNA invertase Pin-like site-specific DNA recombinase